MMIGSSNLSVMINSVFHIFHLIYADFWNFIIIIHGFIGEILLLLKGAVLSKEVCVL